MNDFAPETCHKHWMKHAPKTLAFSPEKDYQTWREQVDSRLRELVGVFPEKTPLNIRVEYTKEHEAFVEKRLVFTSEPGADVPCHLLFPKGKNEPVPVMVCLQGHSPGMHISLGRAQNESEKKSVQEGDRDFALQTVAKGYAALTIEQRCFGEREDNRPTEIRSVKRRCRHPSLVSLLVGRTMVGERVWDVSRAIDCLAEFPMIDTSRVGCMGNSGGGTITYFAACLEPRISAAMPSCYVCTFEDSIGTIDHCSCNYIPNVLRYFEMGDLACLIAPRPLVVVAGENDKIFPIEAVQNTFNTIRQIYKAAGAEDRCELVVGGGGHRFYADASWPVFQRLSNW